MRISESEMEIMRLIWSSEQAVSAAWLMQHLPEKHWKLTTLLTFLARLAEKGVVTITKDGRTNLYSPAISLEQYKAQETAQFIKQIHDGSLKSLFAALATSEQLDQNDLEELRCLLEGR